MYIKNVCNDEYLLIIFLEIDMQYWLKLSWSMPICIYYPIPQSCGICKICIYDEDEIQIISNKLFERYNYNQIILEASIEFHKRLIKIDMIAIYTKEQFNLNII